MQCIHNLTCTYVHVCIVPTIHVDGLSEGGGIHVDWEGILTG